MLVVLQLYRKQLAVEAAGKLENAGLKSVHISFLHQQAPAFHSHEKLTKGSRPDYTSIHLLSRLHCPPLQQT